MNSTMVKFRFREVSGLCYFGLCLFQAVRSATLDPGYMSSVVNHGDAVAELCQSGNGT